MDAIVPCGPVAIGIVADTPALRQRALAELEPFTSGWTGPRPLIRVDLRATGADTAMGEGRFLRCVNTRVDTTSAGLIATCRSGSSGIYQAARRHWHLDIRAASGAWADDYVDDLVELILTTAWREVGWIPLHAGGVAIGRRCALLLAPTSGGKSTLTVAMLHGGWRTLGDDKMLITIDVDGRPEVRGITSHFNLDPRTRTWFPEVGDLQRLPRVSASTSKRRVAIGDIWGDCFATRAVPTHVVLIDRVAESRPTRIEMLGAPEILSALLHQTVIPNDPAAAKAILTVITRSARGMRGVRFAIGDDAYGDPAAMQALEAALE